jgi:hypothetical protein
MRRTIDSKRDAVAMIGLVGCPDSLCPGVCCAACWRVILGQKMKAQLSAKPNGKNVVLALQDTSGKAMAIELDRHDAFSAMMLIAQAMTALPPDPAAALHTQTPALRSKDPSFQVGIVPEGGVVLAIKPIPLPSLEFEFGNKQLDKLIADLRKAATVHRATTRASH